MPLDPKGFIAELKAETRAELEALDTALPKLDWVEIKDRKSGAMRTRLIIQDERLCCDSKPWACVIEA
ncbi:hypothetical protein [Streptosporangium roseum]|uniref:hypothetical protein n=1 Tax=Streptosporangium roseum TaxID=2001 RepID=UPI00068AF0C5|nr:hypothetical protein [Streptosporangium roseum]